MMARSDLLHPRAGYRSARPTTAILKIQLATHGRSIQFGHDADLISTATLLAMVQSHRGIAHGHSGGESNRMQPSKITVIERRRFVSLICAAAARPYAARAQRPGMPVVGFLHAGSPNPYVAEVAAFHSGLNEAGYFEGRNVALEYRWAEGELDRLPGLAADLVRRRVTVIMAATLPAAPAAQRATSTIPIVFLIGGDPVNLGFVAAMNRPGGNMTGLAVLNTALVAKRLDLLRELAPARRAIALLLNPASPYAEPERREAQAAASALGQQLLLLSATSDGEINEALAVAEQRAASLIVSADPFFTNHRHAIVELAARLHIPASYQWRDFIEIGGLISYGASHTDIYRQSATYVGRILNGEKPADLPGLQPTKFELVINTATARSLGLTVSPTLLAAADEVID
jgi:putative tryptophan/tyrosine transport system substrate-binding protein